MEMLKSAIAVATVTAFASLCQAQPAIVGSQGLNTIGPGPTEQHTLNVSLPSGGQLYIYGAATGGAASMNALTSGQTISVQDANGNMAAQLAVTTSDNNSYTTDTASDRYGGIGVSGFNYAQGFYAVNPGPGPNLTASVSFTLSAPALVVVIGMGSGQPVLNLSGLDNPTVDQADYDGVYEPSLGIEHEYLQAGTYTVTVTTGDGTAYYQSPQNEVDLLGVLILSDQANAATSANSQIPLPANFQPTSPTVITGSATSITANSATLNGSVNPNGLATTYYFQWGTTTSYGNNTPTQSVGSGTAAQNVSALISGSGLNPGTTYHYRLVASSSAGTAYGGDQTVTTKCSAHMGGNLLSGTWSGYLVGLPPSSDPKGDFQANAVTDVRGTWTVPALNDSINPDGVFDAWIGIGGWTGPHGSASDNKFVQIGIMGLSPAALASLAADTGNASISVLYETIMAYYVLSGQPLQPVYFAWYETPHAIPPFPIPILHFPVNAGDTISAEVTNLGEGKYQIQIKNLKQNVSSPVITPPGVTNDNAKTAEWIVEYPSIFKDLGLELVDFGTEKFSACSVTLNSGGNSDTGSINSLCDAAAYGVNMPPLAELVPDSLSSDGTSFSVAFNPSAPTVTTDLPSNVTANSAVLNGSINPNDLPTTAYFEWGTSTAYDHKVQLSTPLNGTSTINVSSPTIFNLNPGTTYHFCLFAGNSSSGGVGISGGDQQLTTLPAGLPSPVSTADSSLTATPSLAPADGTSQIAATVTLLDGDNNPVAGKTVQFYASGSASVNQPVNPTDVNGQATATITANSPGPVTITVKDTTDNLSISQPVTVQFTPQTFVAPNTDLQNAIQSLYQGSAQILNGTPTTGLNLATIATSEGNFGPVFWGLAEGAGAQAFIGAAFYGASSLIGGDGQLIVNSAEQTVKNLLGSFLQNYAINLSQVGIDTLVNASVQQDVSSSGGVLVTRGQNVANMCNNDQLSLQGQEQGLLAGVPPAANTISSALVNDLQLRLKANQVLQQYQNREYAYFNAVANAAKAPESTGGLPTTLLETATITGGSTMLSAAEQAQQTPDVGIDAFQFIQDELNDYNNENNYLDEHYAVGNAILAVSGSAWEISNNVNSAFSEISQCAGAPLNPVTGAIVNPSITPVGIGSTTISPSSTVPGSWSGDDTATGVTVPATYDVLSDMHIQNTGTSGASYMIIAFFSCNVSGLNSIGPVPQVIALSTHIGAGDSQDVPIDYFGNNSGGDPLSISPVKIYVLGYNSSGIFYVDSTTLTVGSPSSSAKTELLGNAPMNSSTDIYPIGNPLRCYVNQIWSNQTYQAQVWIENPFVIPLTATVTQALPDGVTVMSTDGTVQGSSIIWTNMIAPSNAVEDTFTFSFPITPGAQTNLPAATVTFSDTNGNSLSLQGVAPSFTGLFPAQISSSIPFGVLGVDSIMFVTVANLSGTNEIGALTVTLTDSDGNVITKSFAAFSLDALATTNLTFTLPGSLPPGSYGLTAYVSINGGTGPALTGNYVVPAPPVALDLGSTPALAANGLNLALQGSAGNYLIEASSDLSSSTNWQPIAFYSSTNASFYYDFTIPVSTNASQQFYRVVKQ